MVGEGGADGPMVFGEGPREADGTPAGEPQSKGDPALFVPFPGVVQRRLDSGEEGADTSPPMEGGLLRASCPSFDAVRSRFVMDARGCRRPKRFCRSSSWNVKPVLGLQIARRLRIWREAQQTKKTRRKEADRRRQCVASGHEKGAKH